MTDCRREFPRSWFKHAKLAKGKRDCGLNFFSVDASGRCRNGNAKAGFIPMIRVDGSNGTAGIIAGVAAKMTYDRLAVGARFDAMWRN